MDSITERIIYEMTIDEILETHNRVPGVRVLSRMGDRTTAVARLRLALERAEMKLARDRDLEVRVPRIVPVGAASDVRGRGAMLKRITLLIDHNPKRPGTNSHERFELYRDGMTMEEYAALIAPMGHSRVKARKDIYTDRDHGYLRVDE